MVVLFGHRLAVLPAADQEAWPQRVHLGGSARSTTVGKSFVANLNSCKDGKTVQQVRNTATFEISQVRMQRWFWFMESRHVGKGW